MKWYCCIHGWVTHTTGHLDCRFCIEAYEKKLWSIRMQDYTFQGWLNPGNKEKEDNK